MRVCNLLLLAPLVLVLGAAPDVPRRVVSLNPSLTAIVLALGADAQLVGVDEYSSQQQPAVRDRPIVGGLFAPRLETILSLEPDLVVWVPSAQQRDLRRRLDGLGVEVLVLPNHTLDELLESIEVLGARLGYAEPARRRVAEIRAAFASAAASAQPRTAPRTLLVLQREPLYVVGGGSFLAAMLAAVGAENVAGGIAEAYPRVSLEWLIAARPEVILDASQTPEPAVQFWQRWPSLPAVADGRVVTISAAEVTLPGPHLERALAIISAALADEAERP
ncbi:MAG: ABC transporter substrate-binding protein [Deltaproteobacteria bacterium]|nr:ABC transporter substrate-binding protein [Deltaproteobacteria bacterium]